MNRASWNFALRAATKVAFATTMVGCEAVVTIEPVATETDADEAFPVLPTVGLEREACVAPAGGFETYDASTFACCVGAVDARLDEGPLAFADPVTEEIAGCCVQILTPNYESLWSGQPLAVDAPDDVIAGCCELEHGNAGCTPWGPPTPPAMDPHEGTPWIALMEQALDAREEAVA